MVKKIGKKTYFLLIGACLSFLYCIDLLAAKTPTISLQLVDQQGRYISKIGVGMPFSVQVTVSGDSRSLPKPEIKGIEQFAAGTGRSGISSSTQIQSINGVTTVSEQSSMQARVNKQGIFEVGPATIECNGQTISSEIVKLEVLVNYQEEKKESSNSSFFARIEVDKQEVYVGEPLTFVVRFYQDNQQVTLEGIEKPQFDEYFTGKDLTGPETGMAEYKGKKYRCIEWKTTLYPKKSGDALIPPIQVVYSEKIDRHGMSDMFGMMQSFFGGMRQNQQISSNSLAVEVKELPHYEGNKSEIKAVGSFTGLSAHLNNTTACQGEGLIYTLTLEGNGNTEQIGHPIILLPEGLTYYDSNARLETTSTTKKLFEYVVQGLKSGDFEIPAQEFTYFDLVTHTYKVLSSEPVTLTIEPGTGNSPMLVNQESQIPLNGQNHVVFETEESIDWAPWGIIPWWLFLLLLIVPGVTALMHFGLAIYRYCVAKNAPELRFRNAFKVARNLFYRARNKGYFGQLYHMYKELFAARLKVQSYELSENSIEDLLRVKGFSEDKIIEWRLHCAYLAEQAFSSHRVGEKDAKLFNEAARWLDELEKIL